MTRYVHKFGTARLTHHDTICPQIRHSKVNSSWHDMSIKICVNIGLGNGLVPDSTKPLPAPKLPYHQWVSVAGTWEQLCRKLSRIQSVIWMKIYIFEAIATSPRGQWIKEEDAIFSHLCSCDTSFQASTRAKRYDGNMVLMTNLSAVAHLLRGLREYHQVGRLATETERWNKYLDRLVQERGNSIALAMELRLSCTYPLTWDLVSMQQGRVFLNSGLDDG